MLRRISLRRTNRRLRAKIHRTRHGRSSLVYHVGRENLPPATAPNYDNPITYHFQVDEPVWVTGFTPKVVDASGKELPGELLHQAIAINLHEDNQLCGGGGGNPFFMATSMLTALELPKGLRICDPAH